MTCIEFMTASGQIENLRIAMFKEGIGIGPERYCVYVAPGGNFERKLQLIMTYLPAEKMFLYPPGSRLGGPFLVEPWLSRGRTLMARPSISDREFQEKFVDPFR